MHAASTPKGKHSNKDLKKDKVPETARTEGTSVEDMME